MNSVSVYDQIYKDNIQDISTGNVQVDPYLADHVVDRRRGISLIIPIKGIGKEYDALVARFQAVAPEPYYYPFEDLHITVFDFVQASAGFMRDGSRMEEYRLVCGQALGCLSPFSIDLQGLVFSSTAGLLAGYDDGRLIRIRESIRRLMSERGLKNDERYESRSAHVTFCRFGSLLADPAGLAGLIEDCRNQNLGTVQVTRMELVEHDWYNSHDTKQVLAGFSLGYPASMPPR